MMLFGIGGVLVESGSFYDVSQQVNIRLLHTT